MTTIRFTTPPSRLDGFRYDYAAASAEDGAPLGYVRKHEGRWIAYGPDHRRVGAASTRTQAGERLQARAARAVSR